MTVEEFWNWFKENSIPFTFIRDVEREEQERLVTVFGEQLSKFHSELYFEIGGDKNDKIELVISAAGKAENFQLIENMIAEAPEMKEWKFVALKQALSGDFSLNVMGMDLSPKDLWFAPLQNPDSPHALGLRLGFDGYEPEKQEEAFSACVVMLDTLLGEKSSTLDIHYLEVVELPEDPHDNGYYKLTDLPEFIDWVKKQR